jgi:predicted alpha/beta hydrolase family esterase
MDKKQVIVIHGGTPFDSYAEYIKNLMEYKVDFESLKKTFWKKGLAVDLGDQFDVIMPEMPCKRNAKYPEWKIWFEKFFEIFNSEITLVGHSLGGIFLAKYLAENNIPKKIKSVHLVAAPFDGEFGTIGDFNLPDNLENFTNQADAIYLYFSKDDPIVPFADIDKYSNVLPKAQKIIFEDRGHFRMETFPEIIENIKKYA